MRYILLLFSILMLTGCQNSMELENRDFVMAMGIEKENEYNMTLSVSQPGEDKDKDTDEYIVEGKGNTIEDALKSANNSTKGEIYLGHCKVIILPDNFKNYDELTQYLNNNIELSRDIILVKSDKPKSVLEAKNNDVMASQYIYDYYENKDKFDLDKLMDMYNKDEKFSLPVITAQKDKIIIK